MSASGAIPKIPMPLPALAAMTPATAVPWISCRKGLLPTLDEIRVVDDLAVEVGMLHRHPGIYHGNFHTFACGPAVRHVSPDSLGAILVRGVLIVMRPHRAPESAG